MRCLIIMPVHNEGVHLADVLKSFVNQKVPPGKLIIVNDNSTDETEDIIKSFVSEYSWIETMNYSSSSERIPGAKVVEAFEAGLKNTDLDNWDLIGKFDGDILLPDNYFETLFDAFSKNPKLGLASGHLYILKDKDWVYESVSNKQKVRGPLKLYRVNCFKSIGGLRKGIGWDTADQLLTEFYGWQTHTFDALKVKHLRPTGAGYSGSNAALQGQAFRNLRYGAFIAFIAALKMAFQKGSFRFFFKCMQGYLAKNDTQIVSPEEGKFIRSRRWKLIFKRMV